MNEDNKRRTLHRLAVTNAWFDLLKSEGPPRYAFRMDVSFREERLGGEEGDPVRFRIGLKRCEVVVILPRTENRLKISRRSIASGTMPATVILETETTATSAAEGSGSLGVGPSGATGNAGFSASASRKRTVKAKATQSAPALLGTRSESSDGDLSWIITRTDGDEILQGMLWSAKHDEPRFELIDQRPEEVRSKESITGLHQTLTVEIRCKREDLDIKGIELTDPEENKVMSRLLNRRKKDKVAEAFIKKKLQEEGLRVGNISEPFSDMVVGDLIVSLVDSDNELPW